MLEVRLLGTFSITSGKKSIALTSRPAQSLLAYLILNAGDPHCREKLAGQVWPESTEEAARDYSRHALWRVRKALAAATEADLKRLGIRLLYMDRIEYEHTVKEVRARLSARQLERLWAKGAALPLDKAIELALRGGPSPRKRAPRKVSQHTLKRRGRIRSRTRTG
jgi:DNA-binding SARP family transcriptional activator